MLLHEELEVGGEGGGVQARATHHPRRQAAQGRVTHRVRDLNKENVSSYVVQDLEILHNLDWNILYYIVLKQFEYFMCYKSMYMLHIMYTLNNKIKHL